MNKSKNLLLPAAVLVSISTVLAAHAQSTQPPPSSAKNSPLSATRANDSLVNACRAVVAELEAARNLITASETETQLLRDRLETEKRLTQTLEALAASQRSETQALRSALDANAEALAAKNSVIASHEELIAELKRNKSSPWRRIGDVLAGAAVVMLLK